MKNVKNFSLFLLLCFLCLSCFFSPAFAKQRSLFLYNTHTQEKFQGTYTNKDGSHNKKKLKEINRVLRDHRSNDVYPIDPCLLDLLYDLISLLLKDGILKGDPTSIKIEVISAYRSPKSNHLLQQKDKGVSKNSLHMKGRAIDIYVPGVPLKTLRDKAKALKRGGVGYYPKSGFIHVDNGRIRCWGP